MAELPQRPPQEGENRTADLNPQDALTISDSNPGAVRGLKWLLWVRRPWKFTGVLAFLLLFGSLIFVAADKSEPRYDRRPLSFWLEALDTNQRFSDRPERMSPYSDEQVERALDAIGSRAFPFIMAWFLGEEPGWRVRLLRIFAKQQYLRLSFGDRGNLGTIAETGFVYYGPRAKSLQPALLKLTHSPDPGMRLKAYEPFFFTRPDRELFLPVCRAALGEADQGVQLMASQWVTERFPEDAKRLEIEKKFPDYYRAWTDSAAAAAATSERQQPADWTSARRPRRTHITALSRSSILPVVFAIPVLYCGNSFNAASCGDRRNP